MRDRLAVQFGIARLKPTAEIETVVETGQLDYDAATGTWHADANGNGWARTPGEYVWQASADARGVRHNLHAGRKVCSPPRLSSDD